MSLPAKRTAALLAAAVTATGAVAIAADAPDAVRDYDLSGTPVQGVRPTATGLPRLGAKGTVGTADLVRTVTAYHDSGLYEKDLETVGAAAKAYLESRLAARTAPAVRTCRTSYRRVPRVAGQTRVLYRRVRTCRRVKPDAPAGKPAIVLDIDETSLSNYQALAATGFVGGAGTALATVTGTGTAIKPVLDLYRFARSRDVAVFLVTGRPAAVNGPTEANLKAAGYDQGWVRIDNKPSDMTTAAFKSGARAKIEREGYTIIANVGDQDSDLTGGHAERAFKLPNPFYFIADS